MIEKEKKYMFLILGIFLLWIIISAFWYTCGLKGLCKKEVKNENKINKELIQDNKSVDDNFFKEDKNIVIKRKEENESDMIIKKSQEIKNFKRRTIKCYTYINSVIKLNSNGNIKSEVKKLENFFNDYYGKDLIVDGIYKSEDRSAVIEFQMNKKLDSDGVVGSKTLEVINAVYCVKNENKN